MNAKIWNWKPARLGDFSKNLLGMPKQILGLQLPVGWKPLKWWIWWGTEPYGGEQTELDEVYIDFSQISLITSHLNMRMTSPSPWHWWSDRCWPCCRAAHFEGRDRLCAGPRKAEPDLRRSLRQGAEPSRSRSDLIWWHLYKCQGSARVECCISMYIYIYIYIHVMWVYNSIINHPKMVITIVT